MTDHSVTGFWKELRRRKVVRVALVYAIASWAAIEVSSVVFPSLLFPEWSSRLVVALALLGFPVALGPAWAFEVTPAGVRRTTHPETEAVVAEAAPEPVDEERLDGWKRIAAHLNRDVRTLRRWEKSEGLPVRRLMHDKLATVYAYRSELDAWLWQRGGQGTAERAGPSESRLRARPGMLWAWVALPLLIVGILLIWFSPGWKHSRIVFGEWDWVLITQFGNRTGEEVLDGTVEYALQRELANSHYVKVVPREHINDALQLMKLPLNAPIDIETGREISLRDGAIRMLITGRIEKLGNTYQVTAELVNPADGVTLASFSTSAAGQDQILPRIGSLASDVRAALGEELTSIAASEEQLAKVTTPSLEALRLFSEANRLMAGPQRDRALPVLEQAVRIDPDFASAHLLLWYALMDRDEVPLAVEHLQKAVQLADQASERERLFILATYYGSYLKDTAKGIETYQLLLRLYPDHAWANGNVASVYEFLGKLDEAYIYRKLSVEWRPNLWFAAYDALQFAVVNHDPEGRDLYLQKSRSVADQNAYLRAGLSALSAHEAWVNGDYSTASAENEKLVSSRSTEQLISEDDGWLFAQVRSLCLALGQIHRFRELSSMRPQLGWFQALLDFDTGDPQTLGRYLEEQDEGFWGATLLALAGQNERARAVIDDPHTAVLLPSFMPLRPWKNLALGQLALSEGRFQDAVDLLGDSPVLLNIMAKAEHLFAMHSLAQAYVALGEAEQAIAVLERARLQKPLTIFESGATYMWQRNELYLHELYLRGGRTGAAGGIAAELRDVLRLADRDHPFLAALNRVVGSE